MNASNFTISSLVSIEAAPFWKETILSLKILTPLQALITSFGLIANVIHIVVFLKAGAKDSVTVLLLSLAMSDLLVLTLMAPALGAVLIFFLTPFPSFMLINFLPYWPAYTAYDLSTFISVSLGVMRCACVAMPLKFKLVFTRSRTVKWVMFLALLAVALRIPVLTVNRLAWRIDPVTNNSIAYLKQVDEASMSYINDILNRGIVIYITYLTMVTCVAILTYKLYQASKIRRSSTAAKSIDQSSTKTESQGLSSKDIQVVKSVVLICTIFVLSQLLFLITSNIRLLNPEFTGGINLVWLFGIFSQVSKTCSIINASVNIFVYFHFNSKFRTVFKSLFQNGKER